MVRCWILYYDRGGCCFRDVAGLGNDVEGNDMNDLAELLLDIDTDMDCFDPVYEQMMLEALDLMAWDEEEAA